jgi:putative transposase
VDSPDRRCEVLALCGYRAEKQRRWRYFIACVDGLKGFPKAIESVFPQSEVQLCIVHMVQHSLNFVGWNLRNEVVRDLKTIYTSATEAKAEIRLGEFAAKWDEKFPMISKSWKANWSRVIPFFAHPTEIRRVIYTTNASDQNTQIVPER